MDANPCTACGACCASFRVSFYWAESPGLADELVERVGPVMACMAGTNELAPRCRALRGRVGEAVECLVYAERPGCCRDVLPGDEVCARARTLHGLPMLGLDLSRPGRGSHGTP